MKNKEAARSLWIELGLDEDRQSKEALQLIEFALNMQTRKAVSIARGHALDEYKTTAEVIADEIEKLISK